MINLVDTVQFSIVQRYLFHATKRDNNIKRIYFSSFGFPSKSREYNYFISIFDLKQKTCVLKKNHYNIQVHILYT